MIKKTLSIMLAVCMALTLIPAFAAATGEAPSASATAAEAAESAAAEERGRNSPSDYPPGAGEYIIRTMAFGKNFAQYYSLIVSVFDEYGNCLYSYDMHTIGEYGDWDEKTVTVNFDAAPATLVIESMYKLDVEGFIYEQLIYETEFPSWCEGEVAVGHSIANDPGAEILFCQYSIEYVDGPIHYVDGDGNQLVQEDYTLFTGGLDVTQPGGWYVVRGDWDIEAIVAHGDCNLVLCDGSSMYLGTGVTIVPGSSLTIWTQTHGEADITIKQRSGDTIEFCGPGICVPKGSGLTINGGRYLVYGGYDDAAIGSIAGTDSGSITINGRHTYIDARAHECKIGSEWFGLECGAAIGGGSGGRSGPITINGGVIKAYGGRESAAIGGGDGAGNDDIVINGGEIYADGGSYGGSGIGAGDGASNGPITINGGVVEAHYGDSDSLDGGAGIGAGEHASQRGTVTINGGVVYAYGETGAGIGGGGCDSGDGGGFDGGDVIITGGCVLAVSKTGAGIGGGGAREGGGGGDGGNVRIDDGMVIAVSTSKGAGIGGGNDGDGGTVVINGGSVTASGGYLDYNYWKAGLADFAPSFSEFLNYASVVNYMLGGLIFSGTYGGAGIGGGDDGDAGTVIINGGSVVATAGMNSARAFGKGDGGGGSSSLAVYEGAMATYGHFDSSGHIVEDGVCYGSEAETACISKSFAAVIPAPCTVTFDMQGHGTAPEQQIVKVGETVEEPADPSAEGWYFGGWYTDTSFSTPFDFEAPVGTLTLTLYARWLQKYPVRLTKIWPDGAQRPSEVIIDYVNEYAPGRFEDGLVVLNSANNWSADVFASDIGCLTLTERLAPGYAPEKWVLADDYDSVQLPMGEHSCGRLFLASEEASGLASYYFDQAKDVLHRGSAEIRLTNADAVNFSVKKEWHVDHSGDYMPESVSAVLQRSYFSDWTTVDTVTLSEENGWQADFEPIVEGNFYYRVRELDQYGSVVLAANDSDNYSGAAQTASHHVSHYSGGELDIDYTVEYSDMDGMLTTITNSCGTVYTISCVWLDENGDELPEDETADSVRTLLLIRNSSFTAAAVTMSAETGWFGAFEPQVDEADYYARVTFYEPNQGYWTVYDESDGIGNFVNRGTFPVTHDGATRYYEFEISYSYDAEARHTTVTLKRFGPRFMARVDFEPDRGQIYAVHIVLQQRSYDEAGHEIWTNLQTIWVPANHGYDEVFDAVPVNDENPFDSYRIREAIELRYDYYGSGFVIDQDDPDIILIEDGVYGRLLFDPGDADNLNHPGKKATYTYVHHPNSSGEWIGRYALSSYYFDETTFMMTVTNTRLDQYDFGEPEWEWNGDYTEATALFTAASDPAVVYGVTASGDAITCEAIMEADCENAGETVYTATVTFNGAEYSETVVIVTEAAGHDWGEPVYEWSADHTVCTASRTCQRDASHVETETVTASYEIIVPPTALSPGLARYTAEFENEAFETQTIDVELPAISGPVPGDVDGDGIVTFNDATMLSLFLTGAGSIDEANLANADFNGDGVVTYADLTDIYLFVLGMCQ